MRFLPLLAPILVVVALSGCADTRDIGGTPLVHPIVNVATLSPSSTDIVILRTTLNQIGGTEVDAKVVTHQIPDVMKGTKPNFEVIAELHPDAVLYDETLISPSDLQKIKDMGIKLMPTGGNSIAQFKDNLYRLGTATNDETNIMDYMNDLDSSLAGAQQKRTTPHKIVMILPGKGSEDMIAGRNSFQADVIRQVGDTPIGPDSDKFVNVNAEQLLKDDPDVVLVVTSKKDNSDLVAFSKDPRFQNLSAVKKGNILGVPADYALRPGGYVNKFIDDIGAALSKVDGK